MIDNLSTGKIENIRELIEERKIGFEAKIRFNDLVKIMVDADMRAVGLKPVGEGDKLLAKKSPNRWWRAD